MRLCLMKHGKRLGISGAQSPGQRWTWFRKGNWEELIRIVATLLLVLLLRWCGIAAAVVGWVSRHFFRRWRESEDGFETKLGGSFSARAVGQGSASKRAVGS